MLNINTRAVRAPYPPVLRALMNAERADESRRWLSGWNGLNKGSTPLRRLDGLAAELGLGELSVKDESVRSPLQSFKALGAPIAPVREVLREHPGLDPVAMLKGTYAAAVADYTVISATDGNHGRGLAAAAQSHVVP